MNDKSKGGKGKGTGTGGRKGPSLTSGSSKPASKSRHASGTVSPSKGKPASVKRLPKRRVIVSSTRTRPLLWLKKNIKRFRPRLSLATIGSLLMTLTILVFGALIYFVSDLPDISGLGNPRKAVGIKVLSAEGDIIGTYGEVRGDYLTFKEVPPSLVAAVVATEDRNFFEHYGVDPFGIARAMMVNLWQGRFVQGGSTITQQLAKNVFLSPERTFKRKFQEMILAFWLERRFSKQEILSIYLNRVYLGAGNFGVDAAARHYFGIPARDLSVAQSAVIAGLLKAPSRYAPSANAELSAKRAHQVLLNMEDAGIISEAEVAAALKELKFPSRLTDGEAISARFFSDWVVDSLAGYLGNVQEDLVVETTLKPEYQREAESAVETVMTEEVREKSKASQTALVSMEPDGAVVAMIGGIDYRKSQYNRAVQAKRQPGSAFKMFVYLTAMEAGYTPDSLLDDKPIQIGKWRPTNYKNEHFGTVTLREAMSRSINTIAVQLGQSVGISRVINTARRLGIKTKLPNAPSLALGAGEVNLLEMTGAYAHLANNGHGVRPYAIREIRRQRDSKILFQQQPPLTIIVLSQKVVTEMNSMLSAVIWGGTGRGAAIGRSAAGKTGTTSDYKDAWFMGYTPQLVTGVWVGNDNNTPMKDVTGGNLPARIWKTYMMAAHKGKAEAYLPVNYQQYQNETLPWNGNPGDAPYQPPQDTGTMPVTEDGQPTQQAPARQPAEAEPTRQAPADDDTEGLLGEEFWDKLFDKDKMEYSYPGQKRQ